MHPAPPAATDPATAVASPRRWVALALLATAQFMLILDVTVVAVALPEIAADLGMGRESLTWVVSAYTLVFGGLMLVGGRAADLFGARRMVIAGLGVFVVASAVAGLASHPATLIAGRVGQGLGAAMLSPAALSLVTTSFHGPERGRALAVWSSLGGAGSAAGVLLGGVLTTLAGWPWVFAVNVPVGLAVLLALPRVVGPDRAVRPNRLDLTGAVTVTTATTALIYGLTQAGDAGWGSPSTWGPLVLAVVLYAGFLVLEARVQAPLMHPGLLTRRPVLAGILLILVATAVLVGGFFLASFTLQHRHGYSALGTGLAFLPVALATIIGARAASRLLPARGTRVVAVTALGLAAGGTPLPAAWSTPAAVVAGQSLAALGLGAAFVCAFTLATAHVGAHDAGVTSGIVNTFHEFGAGLGVAAVSTVAAAGFTAGTTAGTTAPGPLPSTTDAFAGGFALLALASMAAAALAAALVPTGTTPAPVGHGH